MGRWEENGQRVTVEFDTDTDCFNSRSCCFQSEYLWLLANPTCRVGACPERHCSRELMGFFPPLTLLFVKLVPMNKEYWTPMKSRSRWNSWWQMTYVGWLHLGSRWNRSARSTETLISLSLYWWASGWYRTKELCCQVFGFHQGRQLQGEEPHFLVNMLDSGRNTSPLGCGDPVTCRLEKGSANKDPDCMTGNIWSWEKHRLVFSGNRAKREVSGEPD